MKLFELCRGKKLYELEPEQRDAAAKMIHRDVQRIVTEQGISEETAYWFYQRGMFGSDREVEGILI